MGILPIPHFIASCTSHLENTVSLSYVDFPNVDSWLYRKIVLLISPPITSKMSYAAKLTGEYKCSKILIFTWLLEFYHWQYLMINILSDVYPEMTGRLHPFLRKYLPDISVWNSLFSSSSILSSKNSVLWRKQLPQLATQKLTEVLLRQQSLVFTSEVFCVYFSFCYIEYFKDVYSRVKI